jgi:TRAP-type C4-dicarboxylate transport system substrate-binding protein
MLKAFVTRDETLRSVRSVAALVLVTALGLAGPASAQAVKLKLSHFLPVAHNHHTNVIVPWMEEVRKRSQGKVDITVFPGASLCKPTQQYECAKSGLADIAWGLPGWTPGRFPMSGVIELPFMFRTAAVGSQMLADLWDRHLKREFDDVHVLYMHVHPGGHIHTATKPVRTMEDLKGLKIRTPTAVVGDLLQILGATPVGMPVTQIYESMSQRVIDGFVLPFEALGPFKLYEVTKYHTELAMYATAFAVYMNKARYESLPPDVRKALDETTSINGYWKRVGESWDRAEVAGRKAVLDRKNEITTLGKEDRRKWREVARSLDDKWAAAVEAKGQPGRALLKEARDLSARYGEAD